MKTLYSKGRRGILCLSGLLLISTLPMHANSSSEPAPSSSIEVRMKELRCSNDSSLSPALAEVRSLLSSVRAREEGDSATEAALTALELAYGDRVDQTAAPMDYVWYLIGGHWVRYCIEGATFEIDLGPKGTVLVAVRDATAAPTP